MERRERKGEEVKTNFPPIVAPKFCNEGIGEKGRESNQDFPYFQIIPKLRRFERKENAWLKLFYIIPFLPPQKINQIYIPQPQIDRHFPACSTRHFSLCSAAPAISLWRCCCSAALLELLLLRFNCEPSNSIVKFMEEDIDSWMDEEDEELRRLHRLIFNQQIMIAHVICHIVYYLAYRKSRLVNLPTEEVRLRRDRIRDELMKSLCEDQEHCRHLIRMRPRAFIKLCNILKNDGGLVPTQRVSIEEQVAKFLYTLAHDVRQRPMAFFFRRGRSTVSRHFHNVLRAIIELEDKFIKQPTGVEVPPEIENNPRFYPYFKNCVGAIDGTHIRVKVSSSDAPRYRGRKTFPTMNVLAACTFDLKFTYVLPGWEGTASDSRIIKNALTREDKLHIPNGKYYLVDAGFMHRSGLITPFRGVRYHLKEYSNRAPQNSRELFNLRHSSLRNAIERAFGVLKKRFAIIRSTAEPFYWVDVQSEILLACCIIHNFLMDEDPDESLIREVDEEILNQPPHENEEFVEPLSHNHDVALGNYIRNGIAYEMWNDYDLSNEA